MQKITEYVEKKILPAIALRGIVVFPHVVTSFELARKKSIAALKRAKEGDGRIFLVAQTDPSVLDPAVSDLQTVGVIARIDNSFKLPNGNVQVVVEGLTRADLQDISLDDNGLTAYVFVRNLSYEQLDEEAQIVSMKEAWAALTEYMKFTPNQSREVTDSARNINDAASLADYLASSFLVKAEDRQAVLDVYEPIERLNKFTEIIKAELEYMYLESDIQNKVRINLQRSQRDAYLREQLRVIHSELGSGEDEELLSEEEDLAAEIRKRDLPIEVKSKLLKECAKLNKMPYGSQEASVIRNYIEVCLELPWDKTTKDRLDVEKARKILEKDHDGLKKVKERILEYIAVKKLSPDVTGQILCLVGPPGVGKTSIVRSIAKALNKKYVRIALGGVRDEADIRGHRKTYVGSMPGRIINGLKLAGSSNPVMLLDEIDKLTRDAHGDPSSALLEVLDSEQNKGFRDHFVELPMDLSRCMFITTANTVETIPSALLDRLEIIHMDSYSEKEKLSIAFNHLIPKQLKQHGLTKRNLSFTEDGVREIICSYTKEAGVRNLEREIANICRKAATLLVSGEGKSFVADEGFIRKQLGAQVFNPDKIYANNEVGVVNGLAWTALGGEMLRIEALSMSGSGKLELTGNLGDVMKESAKAAISCIRSNSDAFEVNPKFAEEKDIHIHVPEGAVPKDGPSAGISIACALLSALTGRAVKQSVAMTGELTLTGRVLKIGGLKEKSMAAYKAGATTVIIPEDNMNDVEEFDEEIKNALKFVPVSRFSQVAAIALE
ncbi:MAG: endopeptidase La [Clostridia bacterium]|nr:endopeptidase La [Clostridia bacterium]